MKNYIKKSLKVSNGITLIALVITIIVLMIIAGISVAALMGENGLIKRAGDAKIETERAEIEEALRMEYINQLGKDILNYSKEVTLGKVVSALKNQGYKVGSEPSGGGNTVTDVQIETENISMGLEDAPKSIGITLKNGEGTSGETYYAEINGQKYEITDSTGNGDIKISKTPLITGGEDEAKPTITPSTNTSVAQVAMSQDGTAIVITPVGKGTADITVTVTGTSISNKKVGTITITGPLAGGDKSTETVKDNYKSGTKTATIPAGFTVSGIASEQNIDTGLVIYLIPDSVTNPDWTTKATGNAFNSSATGDNIVYDIQTKYDQFVWIPVDKTNKPMYKESTAEGYVSTDPNNKNYEGVLYDTFVKTANSGQKTGDVDKQGGTGYREPDTLSQQDVSASYLSVISTITGDSTSYTNITKFQETMQKDYNEIVKSVEYYGGFWIGRYESSLVGGKTRVIAGKTSIKNTDIATGSTKNMWYGLYARQKNFAADARTIVTNLDSNVKSGMIWGSQYDAMLNWMVANNVDVLNGSGSRTDGKTKNTSRITGATKYNSSNFNDKIQNIYDILGNSSEWTAEAYNTSIRDMRGGNYKYNDAPALRDYKDADVSSIDRYGSRPYLIVSRSGS